VLCSDIEVHREQVEAHEGAVAGFFGCDRPGELADLLAERWEARPPGPDPAREREALASEARFAARYGEIMLRTAWEAVGGEP
jgi:hypothetical protein